MADAATIAIADAAMIATCKIKPTRRGYLYVEVTVYSTVKDLLAAGRKLGIRVSNKTRGWAVSDRHSLDDHCVARVGLVKSWLGAGTVSHEMTHGALMYLYQKSGKPAEMDGAAEPLCYAVGNLVKAFYRWAYRTHVIK